MLPINEKISKLPADWHGAGSVGLGVLNAITKYASDMGLIKHSAETGSGKTTLLFSHLSEDHLVFAMDKGQSISKVKNSELFRKDPVTFVEGPTQLTMPAFSFTDQFDIALIDGPHGYPFPDLEYYYFYPNIRTGGLLLVDDIQIPTIERMFDIIKADDMFDLLEVVENMAFFRRSEATLIDPLSDSWWKQGYNHEHYQRITQGQNPKKSLIARFLRYKS